VTREGTILVTGAGGFVGRHLVHWLRELGREVVAWTRSDADLLDSESVRAGLAEVRPASIFHLAAGPARGVDEPWTAARAEVAMLDNVIAAMDRGCRLIHTGSVAEYGYAGRFDELAPRRPSTCYGFGKAAATDRALAARLVHGLDIRVARLFGVYGPGEAPQRLLPHLISLLSRGSKVPLSDGTQVRDFVHVADVCEALLAIAETDSMEIPVVNVGTGIGLTVRTVCESVADILGADRGLLEFGAVPRRSVDEDVLVADPSRLARIARVPPQRWSARALAEDYVLAMQNHRTP
jgi:nucleoside-diphosphate-sugar epimerase